MKHKDFKNCQICGKGMMHAGHPLFLRVTVERLGVNRRAVERAAGMEMMMGGNALLANIMGPDEDLATVIDGKKDMLICQPCGAEPLHAFLDAAAASAWKQGAEDSSGTKAEVKVLEVIGNQPGDQKPNE